jgi:phosphatidylserine decarboxylase
MILQPHYYYLTILLIPCGYRSYFKLVLFLILIIILQFSETPREDFTINENQILSPVDGKVVVIEEVYEGEYYKDKRLQISIFMSPNVHVTRYAISGIVKFSKYHPGKFLVAWHPKASEENERTTIVIENNTFGLFYTVKLPVH